MTPDPRTARTLPQASLRDTAAAFGEVVLPTLAKGVIIRRPHVVGLAERLGLDRRAVRRMQRLRAKYGDGPLLLRNPFRPQAVILSPGDMRRVLDGSPEPFAVASDEKQAALAHFQPHGVLASRGAAREARRRVNDEVLDSRRPVHGLASRFLAVLQEEAGPLVAEARRRGELRWDAFAAVWYRIVRRVVLGDAARGDEELMRVLAQLRRDANWAFLRLRRRRLRERFFARLGAHLDRAEPGSLAGLLAAWPPEDDGEAAPQGQVPQWLFAFDAAGIATFRALALLACHPEQAATARREAASATADGPEARLPFLRACLLESVRLWPTTPAVLRQTTAPTRWGDAVLPAGAGILVFLPFFHRDGERLPCADRFAPEQWPDELPPEAAHGAFAPFSAGPAFCPGRNLVLLLGSWMLAALLDGLGPLRLHPRVPLGPDHPLPGTLDNFTLRFAVG